MMDDPILEEIYQARQRLLEECNGDLKVLLERLRAAEAEHRHRVVSAADLRKERELAQAAR